MGYVNGLPVDVLFDMGSEYDVISEHVVASASLVAKPMPEIPVTGFSAGMNASLTQLCPDVPLILQTQEFKRDFVGEIRGIFLNVFLV